MPRFSRRVPAPDIKDGHYRAFRPYVREDFEYQCAYCLRPEMLADGKDNFGLDHFRPRSLFPELLNDFYNLYYSCHPCNHTKGNSWPPEPLRDRGIGFVDLCEDEFATHFREISDGKWTGVTDSGRYTIDKVGLNRKHLVVVRILFREAGLHIHEGKFDEDELRRLLDKLEAIRNQSLRSL